MKTDLEKLANLVGRRIRELRYERNWNQVDLEAHMEGAAKRAAISMYETGKRLPSLTALVQLADAFGVPIAALLLDSGRRRHRGAAQILQGSRESVEPALEMLGI